MNFEAKLLYGEYQYSLKARLCMSNSVITKQAIAASFKKLMELKPFDKISISDITAGCNLNRQTFYYHFQDKYELINWIFYNEVIKPVDKQLLPENWERGICDMFRLMLRDKKFYTNAIRYSNTEFSGYLFRIVREKYYEIVEDMKTELNKEITDTDKNFIASFFAYGSAGIITEWIKKGMKEAPEMMSSMLSNAMRDCEKFAVKHYFGQMNTGTEKA